MKVLKTMLLLAWVMLLLLVARGQEFEHFGKPTAEDKAMKICEFDKEAVAVILLDEAKSNYDDQYHLITDHHIRLKILKEKGIEEGNIALPFYRKDDYESINHVEAVIFNQDDNGNYYKEAEVEKKSIFTRNTGDTYGEVKFAFPAVKVGSILEYKYQDFIKNIGGLRDWYFQQELPVMHSYYHLSIPPNTEFAYRVTKKQDYPIIIKPDPSNGSIYFEMNHIAGLREEPFMDAPKAYLQKIIFQLSAYNNGNGTTKNMTTWNEVARELRGHYSFGTQLNKNISGTDELLLKAKLINSLPARMNLIYEFVRSNMHWNGHQGFSTSDGIKDAWAKKNGTSGEINLILINLLKSADMDVYPILVCERNYGKVNTDYPYIDQFNTVYAAVDVNGQRYYLNATDQYTPFNIIPYEILNTKGLLLKKNTGEITEIKNDSLKFEDDYSISMNVNSEAEVKASITEKSVNYAKVVYTREYNKGKEGFINNHLGSFIVGKPIEDFEWKNADKDSLPLLQQGKLSFSLSGTGDYKFLSLNFLPGFRTNPLIADNRFTDINFGYKQSVHMNLRCQLPENYVLDALPKSIRMTNPSRDIEFVRKVYYDKETNQLACMLDIEIKNGVYPAASYDELKEFYKNMFNYLDEQVVVKKK